MASVLQPSVPENKAGRSWCLVSTCLHSEVALFSVPPYPVQGSDAGGWSGIWWRPGEGPAGSPLSFQPNAGLTLLPVSAPGQEQPSDWTRAAGGVKEDQLWSRGGLQGLQRENGRLQEQLRSSEELNASLRTELDLHRSIMAQMGSDQDGPDGSPTPGDQDVGSQTASAEQSGTFSSGRLQGVLTLPFIDFRKVTFGIWCRISVPASLHRLPLLLRFWSVPSFVDIVV